MHIAVTVQAACNASDNVSTALELTHRHLSPYGPETHEETHMPSIGKYPQDVARERQDVPETYEQNRQQLTESKAHLGQTEDPVSGARPETEPVLPEAEEQATNQAESDE